jgi:bifunctional non-homologous end joining protein LigD
MTRGGSPLDMADPAAALGWRPPMLATLTGEAFSREGWVFERKLDGERCLVVRRPEGVCLYSRTGKSLDAAYPELVEALAAQPVDDFVVDGEVVAFEGSKTSFVRLQRRMFITDPDKARRSGIRVVLYLFDLLELLGTDVTHVPLRERKALLLRSLEFGGPVRFLRHRNEAGLDLFAEACRRGWEGVIAKRASSTYVSGRSRDWLKFKCVMEDEFEVVGFTTGRSGERVIGALLLAQRGDDGCLLYAGRVGTGFDEATLADLHRRLEPLERTTVPVAPGSLPGRDRRGALPKEGVHWTEARLKVRVGFAERPPGGLLRHPRYLEELPGTRAGEGDESRKKEVPDG